MRIPEPAENPHPHSVTLLCTECHAELATNKVPSDKKTWQFSTVVDRVGTRHIALYPGYMATLPEAIEKVTHPTEEQTRRRRPGSSTFKVSQLRCVNGHKVGSELSESILKKVPGWVYCVDGENTSVRLDRDHTVMKTVEWKKREELCSLFVQYHKMCTPYSNNEPCQKPACGYFHCKPPPETVAPKKAVSAVRSSYERVNNRASPSHRPGIIPNSFSSPSSPASLSSMTVNERMLCDMFLRHQNHVEEQQKQRQQQNQQQTHRQPHQRYVRSATAVSSKPNKGRRFHIDSLFDRSSTSSRATNRFSSPPPLAETLTNDDYLTYLDTKSHELSSRRQRQLIDLYNSSEFLETAQTSLVPLGLQRLMLSKFWSSTLQRYIQVTMSEIEDVSSVARLFANCLRYVPQEAYVIPITELRKKFETVCIDEPNTELVTEVHQRIQLIQNTRDQIVQGGGTGGSGLGVLRMNNNTGGGADDNTVNEFWSHGVSILPSLDELKKRDRRLKPNARTFTSAYEYLSTHFNMLKEEFVEPLRDGLRSFLESGKMSSRDLSIFPNVQVESVDYKYSVVSFQVTLDPSSSRRLKNKVTTELCYGNIVCLYPMDLIGGGKKTILTDDHFKPIYAIISDRSDIQKHLRISLSVISNEDLNRMFTEALHKKYCLIESPVYFTSVHSVLESLKGMTESDFETFSDILFKGARLSAPPKYIEDNPIVDLTDIAKVKYSTSINVLENWMSDESTFMDSSQSAAIRYALRHSMAVIQGPPGTGKSFVGKHLIKIIHKHLGRRTPIVCICYTNHALDQVLEGLIDHIPTLVRIGGQSRTENEALKDRNLKNLRVSSSSNKYGQKIWQLDRVIHDNMKEIHSIVRVLKMDPKSLISELFPEFALRLLAIKRGDRTIPLATNNASAVDIWMNGTEEEVFQKLIRERRKKKGSRTANRFASLATEDNHEQQEVTATVEEALLNMDNELNDSAVDQPGGADEQEHDDGEGDWETVHNRQQEMRGVPEPEDEIDEEEDAGYIEQQMNELLDIEQELRALEQNDDYDYDDGDANFYHLHDDFDREYVLGDDNYTRDMERAKQVTKLLFQNAVRKYPDLYQLPTKMRREIVNKAVGDIKKAYATSMQPLFDQIKVSLHRREDYKNQQTLQILQNTPLIGLTSTCAAMNRTLLRSLKAPVYVFEEAAELLECQIAAILNSHVQHVIMIGDEKQLQPKVNSYFLAKNMGFSMSMFERLVKNRYETKGLSTQQRMRPEVSSIAKLFYPHLQDHPSVHNRAHIAGMNQDVCFMTHSELEDKETSSRSKTNTFEAVLCAKLAVYLLRQPEHKPKDITIITPYRGQMFLIRSELKKFNCQGTRVVTIDDYQGEENKIIILSLVRSNEQENIGFVGIQNRIIVALSRARDGLYIVGNGELLQEKNDDWDTVVNRMQKRQFICDHLPLCCPNHPETVSKVRNSSDIDKVIHGGCTLRCDYQFDCGHMCSRLCHPGDHSNLKCDRTCLKRLQCGHDCSRVCHFGIACGPCQTQVAYTIPRCGHTVQIRCSDDRRTVRCPLVCGKPMSCGHQCSNPCFSCVACKCDVTMEATCATCNRKVKHKCGEPVVCQEKCTFILPCGHPCGSTCSPDCKHDSPCRFDCHRTLMCGHSCDGSHPCSAPCPDCPSKCLRTCAHTTCKNACGEACVLCQEQCTNRCVHRSCSRLCSDPCDVAPCEERCTKQLKCGHQCSGLCGELCPKTCLECDARKPPNQQWKCSIMLLQSSDMDNGDLIYRLHCGHEFSLEGIDGHMHNETNAIKHKSCPNCNKVVVKSHRYQAITKRNFAKMENVKGAVLRERRERRERQERDRNEVIQIVTRNEVQNQGGHWFECPNGHPYMIADCGGAMVTSRCPDCGEEVGGSSHRLLASNRLATNIENNNAPAWPTALNR